MLKERSAISSSTGMMLWLSGRATQHALKKHFLGMVTARCVYIYIFKKKRGGKMRQEKAQLSQKSSRTNQLKAKNNVQCQPHLM